MTAILLSGSWDSVRVATPGVRQPRTSRAGRKEKGWPVALRWVLYGKILWNLEVTQRAPLGEEFRVWIQYVPECAIGSGTWLRKVATSYFKQ
jgi:hypothetical protein